MKSWKDPDECKNHILAEICSGVNLCDRTMDLLYDLIYQNIGEHHRNSFKIPPA